MTRVLRRDGLLLLADHIAGATCPVRAIQRVLELVTVPFQGEHMLRRPPRRSHSTPVIIDPSTPASSSRQTCHAPAGMAERTSPTVERLSGQRTARATPVTAALIRIPPGTRDDRPSSQRSLVPAYTRFVPGFSEAQNLPGGTVARDLPFADLPDGGWEGADARAA